MAFPFTVLDQRIDILLGSTWTDITSYVQRRDRLVEIIRGRSGEAGTVERSTARFALNNRDGRFSPYNPNSPYYGTIDRNTQLRISLPNSSGSYLALNGSLTDKASCPDAAALGITGDIDIRIDLRPDSWRGTQNLAGKYVTSGNQRSWALQLNPEGTLSLIWSTSGTSGGSLRSTSTLAVPIPASRRLAVRATLDVNNGASGNTATFYYADTISGTWTQLGAAVVTAGTTSIFDGTAALEVGSVESLTTQAAAANPADVHPMTGRVLAFELRSGIGGSIVANPNFTLQAAGVTSFADTASSPNTWTVGGGATIDDRDYRFHGEVPAWPSRWDDTGSDVWVDVEASGILRRIGQGRTLESPIRRGLTTFSADPPIAYWPCEDGTSSASIASGLTDGTPMILVGSPTFASSRVFDCSAALPVVNSSIWQGFVPPYMDTGQVEVRFLVAIPSAGLTSGAVLSRMITAGSVYRWELQYLTTSGGSIRVLAYDPVGTLLATGSSLTDLDGDRLRVSYWTYQDGSDVVYGCDIHNIDGDYLLGTSDTLTGQFAGRISEVFIDPNADVGDAAVGHVSAHDSLSAFTELYDELRAFVGETAAIRIERLCTEEGIEYRRVGSPDDTTAMGPQPINTLVGLLTEAATTDGGILYEPRATAGLAYRTRHSLYNQPATCTLDYSAGEIFNELTPVSDDRYLKNDVTASRSGGSSARQTCQVGPLTPAAVGTYPETYTVNTYTDSALTNIAAWRVHLGTVDEHRYPSISVNLANPRIAADTALVAELDVLDVGDRFLITSVPTWVAPGSVEQLVQGCREVLGNFERGLTLNAAPASPYDVAIVDDSLHGRLDTSAATLASGVTSSATSLSVAVSSGPLWITTAGQPTLFPFTAKLGGEWVTVTAISGSSSPQTWTVTRSANGVVKAHDAGAVVRLAHPAVVAL